MLGAPPNQDGHRSGSNNPAAQQIDRIARAIEANTRQNYDAHTEDSNRNRKIHWWARVSAAAVIIYTAITVGVLIASIRSIQEARRATHAANQAASAATKQAKISEDIEKRQLRAYVFVDKGYVTLNDRSITGVLEIKNTGQTPAYNFIAKDRMRVGLGKTVIGPANPEISRGLLGPGSNPFILQAEIKVPTEDSVTIPFIQNNPGLISIFGQIQYKDAFDRFWCVGFQLRSGRYRDATWPLTLTEQGNEEKEGECPNLPLP